MSAQHGQRRRQRAHGRARIAQKKLQRRIALLRHARRQLRADAGNRHGADVVPLQLTTDFLQGSQHHAGVVGIEHARKRCGTTAQARQQQHTVADAFGARKLHGAMSRLQRRNIKKSGAIRSHETDH